MMDEARPQPETTEDLLAALASAVGRRDAAEVARAAEALRRRDPDHPDVHLARAFLLDEQGRPVEAAAARLGAYQRLMELGGDDRIRTLFYEALDRALGHADGLAMVRPAALASSRADLLKVFVTLACAAGRIEEAEHGLGRLRALPAEAIGDVEEAVAFARSIDDLVWFAPDGTAVPRPGSGAGVSCHHSVAVPALIGAALRRDLATAAFGASLPGLLQSWQLWSEASARECARLLLIHGRDAAASAFMDGARASLARSAWVGLLGQAILSCVLRGAVGALPGYAERLDEVSGCRLAGLTRLASLVGPDAERGPVWGETLRGLYAATAARAASTAAIVRQTTPRDPAHDFLTTGRDSPRDERIDVFLKCVKRPFDIRPFVEFWLECFSDRSRYRVRLLDDSGLDLRNAYPHHAIEDSAGLRDGRNPWVDLISGSRRPIGLLGWESVANLTPFTLSGSDWFWNIDADDIRPLLDRTITVESIRTRLQAVERHARRAGLAMVSYDLWASLHWLAEHGYHWTFGVCFCRNDRDLLSAMLSSVGALDVPSFPINIDHILSRFSDGTLKQGLLRDHFASFVFDRVRLLQLDQRGREYFHLSFGMKKRIDFHLDPGPLFQTTLDAKTLVV